MKKIISRIILWAFLAMVIALTTLYIIIRFIDLNVYKPRIEQAFQQHTGLILEINGPIRLAAPFHLILRVQDVVIRDPEAPSQRAPLAVAGEIDFLFNLQALMHQRFSPHGIEFRNAVLTFNRPRLSSSNTQSAKLRFNIPEFFEKFQAYRFNPQTMPYARRFTVVVKNSKLILAANTAHPRHLTIHEGAFVFDQSNRTLRITGIANFQQQPFDLVIMNERQQEGGRHIKFDLITRENTLNADVILKNGTAKGTLHAKGVDLSNILRIVGINTLVTDKYEFDANVLFKNQQLKLTIFNGAILGGQILGVIKINWDRFGTARYNIDVRGRNLNAAESFKAVHLSDKFSSGRLFLHYQMQTTGHTGQALLANQTGILSLGLQNAQFENASLAFYTKRLFQLMSAGQSNNMVNIQCLVWLLYCESGICQNQALVFNTPGANVIGEGLLNFKDDTVHMMVIPTAKYANLNPLAVPLIVSGPLHKPSISPATDTLTAQMTNILFNIISGRAFYYLFQNLFSPPMIKPYSLMTCVNTLSAYNQQESSNLISNASH